MPESNGTGGWMIFDNTVLSNFAITERLSLLHTLYSSRACTTLMVVEEIWRGLEAGYTDLQPLENILEPLSATGWMEVLDLDSDIEQSLYLKLLSTLDSGEAACLALAAERSMTLASDDLAVRRAAARMGVKLTGTLGILLRAVRDEVTPLKAANDILGQMIAQRYRSPVERLDDLL